MLFVFTLTYHKGKVLPLFISFWKLGVTNKAWWKITKRFYRSSQHVSSYDKIYCWIFQGGSQFLYLNIKLITGNLRQICLLNLQVLISFLIQLHPTLITSKKEYLTVKLWGLTGSAQTMRNVDKTFDKCCNDLEKWLMERSYNEKIIRKQISIALEHSRNDLLEREKSHKCLTKT